MTQLPPGTVNENPPYPPPPPADASQPPAHSQWPGYVAWVVILVVCGLIVLSNVEPELKGREAPKTTGVDIQLSFAAKSIIGLKMLTETGTPATTQTASSDVALLQTQLDLFAKTPVQKARAAMIIGEVRGATEANRRLKALAETEMPDELPEDIQILLSLYSEENSDHLTVEQRQRLIDRHGFFGQVAASFGQSENDPTRRQVLEEARKVMIFTSILTVAAILGILLVIALSITAIVLAALGKIVRQYRPDPQASTVYIEMFAVWLVSYVVISLAISYISGKHPSIAWAWLTALAVPAAVLWALARNTPFAELRLALGWHGGKGLLTELGLGLAGYLAGVPVIAAGIIFTLVLVWISGETPSHPIIGESAQGAANILMLLSVASVAAPLIEETVFRGALFHHMRRRWGWTISAMVVALIFAIIHPQGWTLIPALGSIAIVLAGIREWRGSIFASVGSHAFHNGLLITMLVNMA